MLNYVAIVQVTMFSLQCHVLCLICGAFNDIQEDKITYVSRQLHIDFYAGILDISVKDIFSDNLASYFF